ncbi:MAG: UDP-N-acetylglucosamine--N-acetylmuramyl-(pentapeptide) pyrophosphoryl-undecaprenol N-acetylglucosamine transferase [Spirochaetes bacterium]|nr:UDP-N-acetylglucosamine--N-acetylmuramyl-(pentapeptide) pyrophosphoryl-undecaprenol N-acetylglucosamine transferase [Spirochaetota bacterium]
MKKNILFVGGGSGGHVIPAIPIAKLFLEKGFNLIWIGSKKKRQLEENIIKNDLKNFFDNNKIKFYAISSGKFRRKGTILKSILNIENLVDIFNLFLGFIESFFIIIFNRPLLVFSKGGFVSVPVLISSKILNIKSFTHESDFSLGLANRINSILSYKTFYSFKETAEKYNILVKKGIYTGNPIRETFINFNPQSHENENFKKWLESLFDNKKPILLILGGSLGAQSLNEIIFENLEYLKKYFNIIHQCGKDKIKYEKNDSYYPLEFIYNDIEKFLWNSNLIISRSGANSVFEIIYMKKPAIFVPLTIATRGEQYLNAKYFSERNLCILKTESELKRNFSQIFDDIIKNNLIEKIKNNLFNYKLDIGNYNIYSELIKYL